MPYSHDSVRMVIWALFACLFFVLTAGTPLRNSNGYDYDVKHPGGSSRVSVRSGGEANKNKDYISDASYVNSHYVRPPYQPSRYGPYQGNFNHGHPSRNAPVYVEHARYSKPAEFQHDPSYDQFSAYQQSPHEIYPKQHVASQSAVDAGPFYENPGYSNPHFLQQSSVDDASPSYFPNKLEQFPLEQKPTYDQVFENYPVEKVSVVPTKPAVVQQVVSDDLNEPSGHILQTPIDQQVLVDEPKGTPVISQKTVLEKPLLSQVPVEVPSTKSVPVVAKIPIVQQSSLDHIPPSSIVQYMNNDEISQVAVDAKPSFGIKDEVPVVQQQVSVDDNDYISKKPISYADVGKSGIVQENINPAFDDGVIGKSYGKPIVQTAIADHPSQAVYDSSVEPSFSDTDHHVPPYSFAKQPKYHLIPSGPPYERISHSTEIIHGPPRSHLPYSVPPQEHIETSFPAVKGSPALHSVKLPPPPPPVTKTVIPAAQEHVDADILLTKNLPVSQSVKLPPPPITKTVIPAQEYVDSDIVLTKNPPAVKLPPPPPLIKTVVQEEIPYAQEHVDSDILLKQEVPSPQSVKLLPPPPVTKTVVPVQQQEHIDSDILLTKNPPVSVKLPPPQPASIKLPPPQPVSVKLPPPPPSYKSVKLPPPPPPIYQSVKLPPPPPVTKTAIQAKFAQEPFDVVLTKNPPPVRHSVKLPPPVYNPIRPVYPIKGPFYGYKPPGPSYRKLPPPPPHWRKPHHIHFTKSPPPPSYSVKRPYVAPPFQTNQYLKSSVKVPITKTFPVAHRVKVPVTKTLPPSQGVKVPIISNTHSVKQPKPTYIQKGPPSIKTPPLTPILHSPPSTKGGASYSPSVNKPYPSIVEAHSKPDFENPHLKYPSQDAPPKKYLPDSHDAYPTLNEGIDSHAPPQALISKGPEEKSPFENYPPVSYEGVDSHTPPEALISEGPEKKSPFEKYPPVSHAIRLALPEPKTDSLSVTSLGDKSSVGIVESSPLDKYPRVSHAVRLPSLKPPTTTTVPNLFAAVPLPDPHEDGGSSLLQPDSEAHVPPPKSDSLLRSPISHSVRHPVSIRGGGHNVDRDYDEPKQDFPAFPVESALKQRDPVSEKVADLTNSYTPRASYLESGHEPDDDDSPKAQSVNDAKLEIDRINREIGVSFGDRIPRRSRF